MVVLVLREGYYWPTVKQDAPSYTKKCQEFQKYGSIFNTLSEEIHQTATPWPFSRWGVDIDTFPLAKEQVKFLIVAIDYFTKWIEVEPIATISARYVQNFLWKNVICRHSLPYNLV